jgi:dTDP-4-amino-4,6-dideoxygalactose transaminase
MVADKGGLLAARRQQPAARGEAAGIVTPAPLPFNRPYAVGTEFSYIREAISRAHLAGNGMFSRRCESWLEQQVGCTKALLTQSCTAALEMTALLTDTAPGDEIIMPSFTFVSTANAFALRGGVPVFVDVRPDTLNIDERCIEAAITARTRAIVAVHYAGVGCEMERILELARQHRLIVVEDAAQSLGSTFMGRPLGSYGAFATTSFHETKNIISGEGGALLINERAAVSRAEIVREKGTNRSRFFRGEVEKYTWVELGSSFLPSELTAAFLWAQMEAAASIQQRRLEIWSWYYDGFAELERRGHVRRPYVPPHCQHNGHMFYILVENSDIRSRLLKELNEKGINAVFHFVPLHSAPAGRQFGRAHGTLPLTDQVSATLLRMPMWVGLTRAEVDRVVSAVEAHFR